MTVPPWLKYGVWVAEAFLIGGVVGQQVAKHRQGRKASEPTALCRDGTASYAIERRGACSHHQGVAVRYVRP